MLTQLLIGTAVITATVLVTGIFAYAATEILRRAGPWVVRQPHSPKFLIIMVLTLLWTQAAITVCVWLWALTFYWLGLFETLEPALYFAFASFTTLGFGDILLPAEWRLLSGLSASNGLLLFGLFTAFLVEVMRRIRDEQLRGLPDPE